MLTVEQILSMTDAEAQLHFAACCRDLFGATWQKPFARETDFSPETVSRWMMEDKRPPVWAIRLADTLSHAREIQKGLLDFSDALDGIKALRKTL